MNQGNQPSGRSVLQQHKLKFIILCVLFYLGLLLNQLPAVQVVQRLELPNNISLQQVSGSIWNGQVKTAHINGIPLRNIQWQLNFLPLLLGQANADVKIGANSPSEIQFTGNVKVNANQYLTITSGNLQLPTDMVVAKMPLPFPVLAEGRFQLSNIALRYQLANQVCDELSAEGEWRNASVLGTNGMIPLGNFAADLSCPTQMVELVIQPNNKLNLSATVQLSPTGKVQVSGKFKPDNDLPPEVQQAAVLVGRLDNQGYFSINL